MTYSDKSKPDTRKYVSVILGVAVSAALMALALRNVSLAEAARELSGASLAWLPPMALVAVGDLLVRSMRWRLLLRHALADAGAPPRVGLLLRLEAIGLGINNVLPMRLGEIARAYLAGLEMKIPMLTSLGTIFVERALDTIALLSLFGATGLLMPEVVAPGYARSALAVVCALAAALAALVFVDSQMKRGGAWARRVLAWPRLHALVEKFTAGSPALRSWSRLAQAAFWSYALWLLDAGVYWAAGRAMGIGGSVSYGRSVIVLATAAGASIVPTAPGSFGAFESVVKALLVLWGVAPSTALAYAGLAHIVPYAVVTTLGIGFLYREGHTLGSLTVGIRAGGK